MKRLFGTSGIRGVFGEDLTPERILEIGLAIGTYYGVGSKAIVGWDCRLSSHAIVSIAIGGLLSSGVKVEKAGLVSTPALQKYIQDHKKYDFGLIITASHNPPEYNGIKLIGSDGLEEDIEVEDRIQRVLEKKEFNIVRWDLVGEVFENKEVPSYYAEKLFEHLIPETKKNRFKIVFDYANCVSAITIPLFLNKLEKQVDIINLNYDLDGRFPNRPSEPKPDNLRDLRQMVVETKSGFGVGFDGDGDRALVVDERGNVWWGDALGTVIAKYLKDNGYRVDSVVTPVTSSSLVDMILEPIGIKVIRTRVGAKNIVREMRRRDSILGFEENGGIIYGPHVYTRDGGITTVFVMNIVTFYERPLSEIMSIVPKLHQLKDKVRIVSRGDIDTILTEVEEKLGKDAYDIDRTDGVKIYYDIDRWLLVRPSGTEPIIRIFSEAPSEEEAYRIVEEAKKIVKKYV
jgi:phosphomannomutase/phosphoglucomutase